MVAELLKAFVNSQLYPPQSEPDKEKAAACPMKLVRMKVAAHPARLLFRELVEDFGK